MFATCGLIILLTGVGAAAAPVWTVPVSVDGATHAVKWSVHAVADGAGGAICAWEDNRGRKVCCRDTRDLYAQRIDPAGRRCWGDGDVRVSAEEAGEEVLGLAASPGGGALVVFRRGNGSLFAETRDGGGRAAAPARALDESAGMGEWLPGNGFAVSGDGRHAAVVYALPMEGGSAVRVVRAAWSGTTWAVAEPIELDRAMGLHPGALAWCGDRWLVATWSVMPDGLRFAGRWLSPAPGRGSRPFDLGREPERTWAFVQTAGDGAGGAWIVRAAVNAAVWTRTHPVTVTSVERGTSGRERVRHRAAGTARTAAMFIPPVIVGSGDQLVSEATEPTVAWRPTAWIVPAGPNAAGALRYEDGRLLGAVIRRSGAALTAGPVATLAEGVSDAFTPVAWTRTDGAIAAVWGRSVPDGVRLETATLRVRADALDRGPVAPVAAARSPRQGVPVAAGDGRTLLVYTEALGSESGAIRAVPLPESPR